MTADTILDANRAGNQFDRVHPVDRIAQRPPLVVIVGPTGSGKTGLALSLAEHFPIEIVNADSRAFYRGMTIGTAKPTPSERVRVPHHLVDIIDPAEPMSILHFQALANTCISGIHRRNRIPLLVGGTPQYVNALVEGWKIPRVEPNDERRRKLEREADEYGVESVREQLAAVDPLTAERTGPNLRRIIRALEVFEATGVPFSQLQTRGEVTFDAIEFELWLPREELYARIDARVEQMIVDGLVDEVEGLLKAGYDPTLPAFSSIGYRQMVPAIVDGEDLTGAIERIKLDTHRLVRHQQTWFRKNDRLIRIDMTEAKAAHRMAGLIREFCSQYLQSGQ